MRLLTPTQIAQIAAGLLLAVVFSLGFIAAAIAFHPRPVAFHPRPVVDSYR